MGLASVAGWGGAVFGTLTTIAQVLRIRRQGTDGVNGTTWALFLLMSGFWFAYGVAVHSPEIVVSVVVAAPFLCWLLGLLAPVDRWRGTATATFAVVLVAIVPALVFGWNAGLLGIGALVVATRMPQLLQLVRASHADGVSVSAWLLGALSVALWLAYYASTSRYAAAASMLAALVVNLAIVALTVLRQRSSRLPAPELVFAGA